MTHRKDVESIDLVIAAHVGGDITARTRADEGTGDAVGTATRNGKVSLSGSESGTTPRLNIRITGNIKPNGVTLKGTLRQGFDRLPLKWRLSLTRTSAQPRIDYPAESVFQSNPALNVGSITASTPGAAPGYFAGRTVTQGAAPQDITVRETRDFFAFDLGALEPPLDQPWTEVKSVRLDLQNGSYSSIGESVPFELFDVNTPAADLLAGTDAAFEDAGEGTSYGLIDVAATRANPDRSNPRPFAQTISILSLNASAIAAVTDRLRNGLMFTLGGRIQPTDDASLYAGSFQGLFGQTVDPARVQLVIEFLTMPVLEAV